ncbi:hypothetical protein [Amaricoccus sp.]|uniref:hypothetical protein n=1 Tax=Amaricoccus sp. TaxID=1872485 RepID=UPI001B650DBE|nr:hypothetical protein [Amaricoccus sp.]MBP7002443.1 hypothetical protein [Amaricoccus sp.]
MTLEDASRPGDAVKDAGCGCGCASERADAKADCLDACEKAYNACLANAGSDLEKAACHASYNKCITDC